MDRWCKFNSYSTDGIKDLINIFFRNLLCDVVLTPIYLEVVHFLCSSNISSVSLYYTFSSAQEYVVFNEVGATCMPMNLSLNRQREEKHSLKEKWVE
jgi:hypothetical protein